MKSALVIIDMQEDFRVPSVIPGVLEEIQLAHKTRIPVFVVEFEKSGQTLPEIKAALGDLEVTVVSKRTTSAAKNLAHHLKEFESIRICGVYSDCCVFETIRHLSAYLPRLE